jgi:hypothetical protein
LAFSIGAADSVSGLLKKIRNPNPQTVIKHILQEGSPEEIANKTGHVVGVSQAERLYVCVHGGFVVDVPDVATLLMAIVLMRYILHINFPESAKSTFNFLCYVFGERSRNITLSKTQKEILGVSKAKKP